MTISPPKFKQKYRIASSRLKDWDYTAVGWYFITICTGARIPFFGEIEDGDVRRSPLGKIALQCWLEIPNHFSQASLDEFIIMPNHVHGIIVIHLPKIREGTVETQHAASLCNELGDHSLIPRDRLGSNAITINSSGVLECRELRDMLYTVGGDTLHIWEQPDDPSYLGTDAAVYRAAGRCKVIAF